MFITSSTDDAIQDVSVNFINIVFETQIFFWLPPDLCQLILNERGCERE